MMKDNRWRFKEVQLDLIMDSCHDSSSRENESSNCSIWKPHYQGDDFFPSPDKKSTKMEFISRTDENPE